MTLRTKQVPRRRGDEGVALIAALTCLVVVMGLSAAAVSQSVGSLSATAQARKILRTVDAAEAGIQAEFSALRSISSASAGTAIPCHDGSVTITQAAAGQPNVADPASLASFTLSMTPPSATLPTPTGPLPATDACASNSYAVPSTTPWYVVVQAAGTTSGLAGGGLASCRSKPAGGGQG